MIIYGIIFLVVLPVHYVLYKIFEKKIKLSKQCIINLTGILSIFPTISQEEKNKN